MVPDLDLQLQAAIKALTDTVAPAVDPANRMAVEQLGLAIATLAMVRGRLPLARRMARRMVADAISLAQELSAAAGEDEGGALAGAAARARAALDDPAADTAGLDAAAAAINGAVADLVAASAELPHGAVVEAIVIRRSRVALELRRAWNLPAGFEPYPERLASIESQLA